MSTFYNNSDDDNFFTIKQLLYTIAGLKSGVRCQVTGSYLTN